MITPHATGGDAVPRSPRTRAARRALLLLPSLIVLVSVVATTSIAASVQERGIRDAVADRVHDVATSIAALPQVRDEVARADAGDGDPAVLASSTAALQPLVDVVEEASGVSYVVITDEDGIRLTHPTPSERGRPASTDASAVLAGEEFLGTETGTLGPTLRAKVPVRDGGAVIGALSVGISESSISAEFRESMTRLLPWAIGSLLAALLASAALSALIERRFRRLDDAAREHERLERTATALREQTHDFHTRLHVIHGLVSHGDDREALDYIAALAPVLTESDEDALIGQPLLRATVEGLRAELGALGAALEADVEVADEIDDDVSLAIANLCRNAAEAGATRVRCTLRQAASGERLHAAVDDDGPGIDPTQAERVFQRGHTTKPDGTGAGRGIGLAVVRRIATSRGGSVELSRSDLGGAQFAFDVGMPR
ncbi:sensor histidine kinase [Microbacterium sp. gxy059]|uniref:sensor histidine kinase n=1 Tax=Microbacterium sp. gxy059 TaxID=2957199 RepID=UPI003D97D22E